MPFRAVSKSGAAAISLAFAFILENLKSPFPLRVAAIAHVIPELIWLKLYTVNDPSWTNQGPSECFVVLISFVFYLGLSVLDVVMPETSPVSSIESYPAPNMQPA